LCKSHLGADHPRVKGVRGGGEPVMTNIEDHLPVWYKSATNLLPVWYQPAKKALELKICA
jgi:hypothetical protein